MLGWAAISGQSTALVTLTSQVHGAVSGNGNSESRTDVYVNVATLVHVAWTVVPFLALPVIYRFLLSLGQDPSVVNDGAMYFGLSILTLPSYAVFVSYRRYLDALLLPWPGAMLCGGGVLVLALLLPVCEMLGVPAEHAAPVSLLVLWSIFAVLMVRHVGPVHQVCSVPSMRKLRRYTFLAFPAMLSMMAEWWSTEVLVVAAARIGTAALTANAVSNTLLTFLYQVSYAVSSSCSARVGYWLGAGHPKRAKQCVLLHTAFSFMLALLVVIPLVSYRTAVAAVLVGKLDAETVALTETLIPMISLFFLIGAIQSCVYGAMCGAGMQHISLCNTLVAYWPIAARVGYWLGAGHPKRAKQCVLLHTAFSFMLALLVVIPLVSYRTAVAAVLVGKLDAETVALTETLIPMISLFFLIGAIQSCVYGAMCGAGMQHISLCNTLVAYWPIGVPVALYLGFTLEMGVVGFWYGLTIGLLISLTLNGGYLLVWVDWETIVDLEELARDAEMLTPSPERSGRSTARPRSSRSCDGRECRLLIHCGNHSP
eukprot:TRINITY_DN10745_c0_g1_i2.p1 TRINITY_DN10745_c0_g1~~TRINITY_DN10745_c0_g1_i2.p1  ORF type:complete len:626 (+),score=217.34 TRINITY_DN10745_c0_g1_i2:259-1878(+)